RVNHMLRITAGLEGAEQFPAAGDVESAPLGGEDFAKVNISTTFDGITDRCIQWFKRVGDLPVMMQQSSLGVHICRRAHFGGDFRRGNAFTIEFAVTVVEKIHAIWFSS